MKEDPSELWHQVGKTLWLVQLAEYALVYFAVANRYPKPLTEDELEKVFVKQFKPSIGIIIGNLRTANLLTATTDKALSSFVDERNWLAHHIRRENHGDLYHEQKYQSLISRLISLQETSKTIATQIEIWLDRWAQGRGMSKETLDAEAERIYQSVRTNA